MSPRPRDEVVDIFYWNESLLQFLIKVGQGQFPVGVLAGVNLVPVIFDQVVQKVENRHVGFLGHVFQNTFVTCKHNVELSELYSPEYPSLCIIARRYVQHSVLTSLFAFLPHVERYGPALYKQQLFLIIPANKRRICLPYSLVIQRTF